MAVTDNDFVDAVAINVHNQHRNAGVATKIEFLDQCPFPGERACGRGFQDSLGRHELAPSISIDIPEAQPMTETMRMDDMFFEFPRRDKFIGAEGLPGRVWNDLQLTVAVDVPSASGLNVSDIFSHHQLLPGSHAPTKFVFAGIFAPA